jgi:hypothetical protein
MGHLPCDKYKQTVHWQVCTAVYIQYKTVNVWILANITGLSAVRSGTEPDVCTYLPTVTVRVVCWPCTVQGWICVADS